DGASRIAVDSPEGGGHPAVSGETERGTLGCPVQPARERQRSDFIDTASGHRASTAEGGPVPGPRAPGNPARRIRDRRADAQQGAVARAASRGSALPDRALASAPRGPRHRAPVAGERDAGGRERRRVAMLGGAHRGGTVATGRSSMSLASDAVAL